MTYQGLYNPNEFYTRIEMYLSVLHLAFPPEKQRTDTADLEVPAAKPLRNASGLRSPVVPPPGRGTARDPHPLTLPTPPSP